MGEVLLAAIMGLGGAAAIHFAVRHNKYLVSYNEDRSLMFYLFGRTGLRVFWVIFGLLMLIAAILVAAEGIRNM